MQPELYVALHNLYLLGVIIDLHLSTFIIWIHCFFYWKERERGDIFNNLEKRKAYKKREQRTENLQQNNYLL